MKKISLFGAALASVLAFPAVASAHTAKATIDCSGVKAYYTAFAATSPGNTNTVYYKVTVDGAPSQGTFDLKDNNGREGTLTLTLALADGKPLTDGKPHMVAFYTAWGANGGTKTVDGHSGGSMKSPLASKTITCAAPPATPPTTPPAPPATPPAPPATPPTTPPAPPTTPPTTPPAPPTTPPAPPAPAPVTPQSVAPASAQTFPSVKSKAAGKPADCVSTPKAYRVRAGQMNTINVRVRVAGKDIAGAKVKLTAPGVTRIQETDSHGRATFRVKPRKSGTMYVQSDQCSGADRATVLAAKQASGRSAPRFTG